MRYPSNETIDNLEDLKMELKFHGLKFEKLYLNPIYKFIGEEAKGGGIQEVGHNICFVILEIKTDKSSIHKLNVLENIESIMIFINEIKRMFRVYGHQMQTYIESYSYDKESYHIEKI